MTVIAAARAVDGSVTIGADTETEVGYIRLRSPGKLHEVGSAIISGYGIRRVVLKFVEFACRTTELPDTDPVRNEIWLRNVASHWATSMREAGEGTTDANGWTLNSALIVAMPGAIWRVDGSGWCDPVQEDYTAGGSGAEVAMGALYADRLSPRARPWLGAADARNAVQVALAAACQHSRGCGGPVHILTTIPVGSLEPEEGPDAR